MLQRGFFLLLSKSRFAKTVISSFILLIGIAQTEIFLDVGIASESDPGYEAGDLMVSDPSLKSELVYKGIQVISNMAFLGPEDILVLERIEGTVKRIVNGTMQQDPLIDLNVVNQDGLTGIATSSDKGNPRYVFLYVTEAPRLYQQDIETAEEMETVNEELGYTAECNCVYRYEFDNGKLINPALILGLPATPGPMRNGGEILLGPDGNLYVTVGDLEGYKTDPTRTKAQNYKNGTDPDGRAGILRVTQDGQVVDGSRILGDEHPLDIYYAYGIRNSFGMDFDPITGNLWSTDNGPDHGDEINLVTPGMNGGADYVFGISSRYDEHTDSDDNEFDPDELADFEGKGKYSDPEFTWEIPEGVTALQFLDSDKYGEEYENDMFVASWANTNRNIYHFDLNEQANRTELLLEEPLNDAYAVDPGETDAIAFASGPGITDLQVGPDGLLYVLSTNAISDYDTSAVGTIYKIVPKPISESIMSDPN
jgi:aldose sugar dehydrogenase